MPPRMMRLAGRQHIMKAISPTHKHGVHPEASTFTVLGRVQMHGQ